MKPLCIDVETTTIQKGSPYVLDNKLCYVGTYDGDTIDIKLKEFTKTYETRQLIGFNLKFDLSWLKRYDIDYSSCSIWDCQLAHFLLTSQQTPYPSLNLVANYYGIGKKLDTIAEEYWDKGIDTPDIPEDLMREYLTQDLLLTYKIYLRQIEDFKKYPKLYKLFLLQCEDLLVLQEMEFNGLLIDVVKSKQLSEEATKTIETLDEQLQAYAPGVPINFNSGDHLSCLLYGGTIEHKSSIPNGVFKTGARAGQQRYKSITYAFPLAGLFKPPKGSNLAKKGYFKTDEETLKSLTGNKEKKNLLTLLEKRAKLDKLNGTYYVGWPIHVATFDGKVHGQFNQCVARTGRLSSSKPNQQNIAGEFKELLITRYPV
jgi:DNA polymerase-1